MVNQRLALGGGFQPCSTIKVSVALAALHEGILKPNNLVHLTSRYHLDLTEAIAHSNNYFFASLGIKLGYDKVSSYAHQFGYGEKAGLNIPNEQPGYFPPKPARQRRYGDVDQLWRGNLPDSARTRRPHVAVANGGTLYWLQYPVNQEQVASFNPQDQSANWISNR